MASQPSGGRSKDYDHLVKLLLIGDSGVGKSCLLLRFSEDSFTSSFITTIGIDFKIKKVLLDGQSVKLQIWDTAGQERFRTITASYYRGAMGILLVYDVGDERSFASVRGWMKAIDANAVDGVVRALVGNKADFPDSQRAVSAEQGAALAREFGVPFFETSAKSGDGVDEAFSAVAREVVKRMVEGGGGWPPGSSGGAGGGGEGGGGAAGGSGGLRLGRGGSGRRAKSSCCS